MTGVLFLDDCPRRCAAFARREPSARVVHTAAACIAALAAGEAFEDVHLDHDLGGETYCESQRVDTGMEVVRWIALYRPDVRTFVVHTHNEIAGPEMVRMLQAAGYRVVRAPFTERGE